jgi:hypothetical protein
VRSNTIKSYVYSAHKEGLSAEETWRAAQSLFPHKCVSWGYIVRLRKMFAEGDQIAKAFAELISASRART